MLKLAVCVLFSVPLAVSAARQAKAKPARGRDAASVIVAMERTALDRSLKGDLRIIHTHWSLLQPKAGQP